MFSNQIEMIRHGYYFDDLKVLQTAIEKKGTLPKGYFNSEKTYCVFVDEDWKSKRELKEIRRTIVNEIIAIIKDQNKLPYEKKMPIDHYSRLFHALSILKVNQEELHETCNDYFRNAFLMLWKMEYGTPNGIWDIIDAAAWFISEAVKGVKGEPVRETVYPEE